MKRFRIIPLFIALLCSCAHDAFVVKSGETVTVSIEKGASPVLYTAFEIFQGDVAKVLGADLSESSDNARIIVATADSPLCASDADVAAIRGKHETFVIKLTEDNRLLVAGSDAHGAAYGLMELSSMMGVSPWEWWADSEPRPIRNFSLPAGFKTVQGPSVAYRGIFINDEDFGLNPWSYKNYEPSDEAGVIGPKTNARIFELLLRLKANLYWPAMHNVSKPFFLVDGNREVAAKYGIYIGSSHCEPMACNANGEWYVRGNGKYDFINNRDNVVDFWKERLQDVAGQEIVYTLGMRGVHDGPMEGVSHTDYVGQRDALVDVLKIQRELIADCVNPDVTAVPQVFIPYKEVLLAYNEGLDVPEDVTLMWCDDNYGFIRHFPTEQERARKGGNGIYYHVSYWGRPHDYLWLSTLSPALIQQQMGYAFDRGIDRMWVLNVGDIKPAEYQIELFMDMAWDMARVRSLGVKGHLEHFLRREFGDRAGARAADIMMEHYRLAYIRKPEFMGNTREEERDPSYKVVKDLPWSQQTIVARLADYDAIHNAAEKLAASIPQDRQTSYFQLVQYPVQAAALMNVKTLKAQLARHGMADWAESDAAYDEILALTDKYNTDKWHGIMSAAPRNLPVFKPVPHETVDAPLVSDPELIAELNAADGKGDMTLCEGLGYNGKAALVHEGGSVNFTFRADADSVKLSVFMVPTHPVSGGKLRFNIALDGVSAGDTPYETYDRSEEWKENILNSRALREFTLPLSKGRQHTITFTSLDQGVLLDRILVTR